MSTATLPRPEGRRDDGRVTTEDFFGVQRTPDLPDPEPMIGNLALCILEVLAGVRELEQLMRWVTEEVHATLLHRAVIAANARTVKGQPARRPQLAILRTLQSSPRPGVVEAVVIVRTPARVRSIAIRLEALDGRWRASAIHVL